MRWSVVVLLAGCGFQRGALPGDAPDPDARTDAPGDVMVDMVEAPCLARWHAGTARFDTPAPIAEVNTTGADRDPFLTSDERTLYLASARTGTSGGNDVWVATRASVGATFSTPVEASEFNSTSNDTKLSLSADQRIAVLASDRPGSVGADIWESIRGAATLPFPAMNKANLGLVNTTGSELDPALSADGQRLYLAVDVEGRQQLGVALRAGGPFAAPVLIAELNGTNGDADPALSPDERVIVFSSNRRDDGNGDIWYATRASAVAAFSTPVLVPDIATGSPEGDPHLSSDGCRLYFARNVGGGDYDIFVASMQ